jgi:serine protease Do
MMKVLGPVLYLLAGLVIGIIVFHQFQQSRPVSPTMDDSARMNNAYAQQVRYDGLIQDELEITRRNAITEAVDKVSPAVVSVNVTKIREFVQRNPFYVDPFFRELFPELFSDRRYQQYVPSVGSGFIISPEGHILTNEHVVENATEIIVAMGDAQEVKAEIIGTDPIVDVALLKIEGDNFPYVHLGDSDNLIIGEWAIALGNPFGLFVKSKPTVTVGVISAVDRDFSRQQGRIFEDMIQTDASINPGNSGGPLCNAMGEVIGINTFIYTETRGSVGIGFAIPINRVKRIVEDLKTQGIVDRNIWIGLYVSNLSRFLVRQLNYPSTEGVYVVRIDKGSPAEKAGIKLGDIITRINDRDIRNDKEAEAVILSADLKVGDELKIRIWRDDKYRDVRLVLARRS